MKSFLNYLFRWWKTSFPSRVVRPESILLTVDEIQFPDERD